MKKNWYDANGKLRHLVSQVLDTGTGDQLVISRSWRPRHECWDYHAETIEIVEFHQRLKQVFSEEQI